MGERYLLEISSVECMGERVRHDACTLKRCRICCLTELLAKSQVHDFLRARKFDGVPTAMLRWAARNCALAQMLANRMEARGWTRPRKRDHHAMQTFCQYFTSPTTRLLEYSTNRLLDDSTTRLLDYSTTRLLDCSTSTTRLLDYSTT